MPKLRRSLLTGRCLLLLWWWYNGRHGLIFFIAAAHACLPTVHPVGIRPGTPPPEHRSTSLIAFIRHCHQPRVFLRKAFGRYTGGGLDILGQDKKCKGTCLENGLRASTVVASERTLPFVKLLFSSRTTTLTGSLSCLSEAVTASEGSAERPSK